MPRPKKPNQFALHLHRFLKNNKIKKYKFAAAIGVSNMTLHRYCENETSIPIKVKRAIMQYTNNIIDFPEIE